MRPYEIVCAQCLWAVGAVQPRQPPAADSQRAPCRRCPIHLRPQREQCHLARRGVAHCRARVPVVHPSAATGVCSFVKGLTGMVGSPKVAAGATGQVPLRGAGTGGGGPPLAAGHPHARHASGGSATLCNGSGSHTSPHVRRFFRNFARTD